MSGRRLNLLDGPQDDNHSHNDRVPGTPDEAVRLTQPGDREDDICLTERKIHHEFRRRYQERGAYKSEQNKGQSQIRIQCHNP